jgi:hypothetical protein
MTQALYANMNNKTKMKKKKKKCESQLAGEKVLEGVESEASDFAVFM